MSLPLTGKIAEFLKKNHGQSFTTKEIAKSLIADYPDEYNKKKIKSGFSDDRLLMQVEREISSRKDKLLKLSVSWDDLQKPRRYFYQPQAGGNPQNDGAGENDGQPETGAAVNYTEADLYAPLMDYLHAELGLFCMRIRENTSKNSLGSGANKWLHPDIVAMQPLDKNWNKDVAECLKESGGSNVRLWSFEVKKSLTLSNLRQSFFQSVSNSSWANEGYLAACSFGPNVEPELRILSSLHGIGVIKLNIDEPTESEIILPSAKRQEVDWQSVNRIAVENRDFINFIKNTYTYFKTRNLNVTGWNQ